MTYICTDAGWRYLVVVPDLYSRRSVGWSMAPTMPAGLVVSALETALQQRHPPPGMVLHSDRTSQDASAACQATLARRCIEAPRDIVQYVVGFYNPVRLCSTLGYLSPCAYEAALAAKQLSDVSEIT
ncbi:DDE-type integrase/transposase/recombinase [Ralstonia pseudosolanacearum]|nr:DDE-type integrase/transposase/recombinase [Ralstonia pseudosolanacearum]